MDNRITDVNGIPTEDGSDVLLPSFEDTKSEPEAPTETRMHWHRQYIYLSLFIGAVTATILLSLDATRTALSSFFDIAPLSYASLILGAPKNILSIITLTAELSITDSVFSVILVASMLFIHRRCYLSVLLFLRTVSLALGAGLVIISGAAVYGKIAVGITYAVAMAASLYAALPLSSPTRENIRFSLVLLKNLCALGAVILCRAVTLILGAYFF